MNSRFNIGDIVWLDNAGSYFVISHNFSQGTATLIKKANFHDTYRQFLEDESPNSNNWYSNQQQIIVKVDSIKLLKSFEEQQS